MAINEKGERSSRWGESSDGEASLTPVKGERKGRLGRKRLRLQDSSAKSPGQVNGESPSKDVHWRSPMALRVNLALVFLTVLGCWQEASKGMWSQDEHITIFFGQSKVVTTAGYLLKMIWTAHLCATMSLSTLALF